MHGGGYACGFECGLHLLTRLSVLWHAHGVLGINAGVTCAQRDVHDVGTLAQLAVACAQCHALLHFPVKTLQLG